MIKENLNIDVEVVATAIRSSSPAALNAKPTEILFGFIRYGMDFFDPVQHAQRLEIGRPPFVVES